MPPGSLETEGRAWALVSCGPPARGEQEAAETALPEILMPETQQRPPRQCAGRETLRGEPRGAASPPCHADTPSGPVFLPAPWEVWVCYKDILGVSQTQVCLVGSTFGQKYRGYRSPKNEKWGCEWLRCGGGGSGQAGRCAG